MIKIQQTLYYDLLCSTAYLLRNVSGVVVSDYSLLEWFVNKKLGYASKQNITQTKAVLKALSFLSNAEVAAKYGSFPLTHHEKFYSNIFTVTVIKVSNRG